jgi:outer membrane biosynthesis protein TonB
MNHHLASIRPVSSLACVALLIACAGPRRPPRSPPPAEAQSLGVTSAEEEVTADEQPICDLVCEQARIVPRPADTPDYTARATGNANAVMASMQDDLSACYTKRLRVNPEAHGFITVDVVIGEDGRVRSVETTGGAILGKRTMDCIVRRIQRASFDPPHGGGTLRVHVPFSLRPHATEDTTF